MVDEQLPPIARRYALAVLTDVIEAVREFERQLMLIQRRYVSGLAADDLGERERRR